MAFDHDTAPKGATKSATGKTAAKGAPAETMQLAQAAGALQHAVVGTRVVPAANGVVRLPAGTSLDNIHRDGNDLVIQLPDGSIMLVPNGAVTVPEIIVGETVLPPANVLALLGEVQPAAGPPSSSGGNFATPLGDIGPGIGIGDLLPPTELAFSAPQFEELHPFENKEPTVIIVTPTNPGAPEVTQSTSDAGLGVRNGEPAGTQAGTAPITVNGTIVFTPGNEPATVTINGQTVVVGAVIPAISDGQQVGTLLITSVAPGVIGYTFTQSDNVQHVNGNDDQIVLSLPIVVTDADGDTATGSLTITIMDDAPIARADIDSVTEDANVIANGNVITGALIGGAPDANATDGVADTPGADGATVTGVAVGSLASASGNIGATLNGTFGSLVLSANGNYVYTLNNSAANVQALRPGQSVTDTFTYTLTDGDGDQATTTLTITINGSNDAPPSVTATAAVSEEGLAGGLIDSVGTPDTTNAATFNGNVTITDPDNDAVTVTLTAPATALTSGGVAITWAGSGTNTLIGSAGGVEVVRVTINNAGAYTVTLSKPIDHATVGVEDSSSFVVGINLNDGTVTTTNSTLTISVEDDSPTMGRADVSVPTLTVDETVLSTDASGSFAGVFTSAFGGDGAGTLAYSLSAVAGASGLTDVATGQAVNLVMNGGVVEGRTAGSNALVFTVSVAANGTVTLDQLRAVVHADTSNPDDARTLSAANLVTLTATITDRDGDTASQAVQIGQNLVFKDDGPSISATAAADALVVDETNLAVNASANFADNFTSAFGADGAGTLTYAVNAVVGASGLIDVASGQAVNLVMNAGVVEGRTAGSNLLVFTVSVAADGTVTLDQVRAVQHPDAANPDDAVTLSAANLITVTATITDKDGDTASATINVGQALSFKDDGPSVVASTEQPTLTVDETTLATNATASFAGVFTPSYGADGAGTVGGFVLGIKSAGVASGLVDVATGEAINLVMNAGVVEGRTATTNALAFTITVAANGDVTLDQIRAIQHTPDTGPDQSASMAADDLVTLTATVTDKDGDTATATAQLGSNFIFKDDAPTIRVSGEHPPLIVDESNLAIDASAAFAGMFVSSYGADGPGTLTYALSAVAGASGLTDVATGEAVNLVMNGGVVEGRTAVSSLLVFTVTVNVNGTVTLDQIRAVSHPDGTDPNDSVQLTSADLVTLTATITDKDGDSASSAGLGVVLRFNDDGPSLSASATQPTLTVDETVLATNATADFSGVFTPTFGADGAGTVGGFALGLKTSVGDLLSGLVDVATGETVKLVMNAGVVEGRTVTTDALVFTLSVDGSGNVTLDQIRAVQHTPDTGPDQSTGLSADDLVTLTATVTDKDGDTNTATAQIGSNLIFKDDAPTLAAGTEQPTLTVDETTLATNATADFSGVFTPTFGADGAGTVSNFVLGISAPNAASGLTDTATGEAIKLVMNGTTVEGRTVTTDALVFTVTTDASGHVTLDQIRAIVHTPNTGPDQSTSLTSDGLITLTATVTDRDGDTSTATANIGQNLVFKDDAPTAVADTGNTTEGGTLNVIAANGVLSNDAAGADGKDTGAVVGVATGSNTASPVSGNVGTTIETTLGFLTLNADGSYSYQSKANSISNNAVDHFVYTMVDKDGDPSTVTLDITIQAGGPELTNDDEVLVYEKALDTTTTGSDLGHGSVTGSLGTTSPLETDASNTLTDNVTGGAGTLTYTLVGSATGLYGTIQINANGTYVYTLTSPYDTSPDANDGANTEQNRDSFTYRVTDSNGNFSEATIFVDIVDDVPVATLDTGSVNEGATLTVLAAAGVLVNDTAGADGLAAGGGVVGVRAAGGDTTTAVTTGVNTSIAGLHGTLTLHADGSYTYVSTANNINANTTDVFVYSIKDGDGDLATTTLTINLTDSGLVATNDDEVLVYEKALDTTVTGSDLAAGSVTGSLGTTSPLETDASNTLTDNVSGGFGTKTYAIVGSSVGTYGTIQINSDGTYTYTLTSNFLTNPATNDGANTEQNRDSFTYRVTDANGNTTTATIFIDIVDDTPTAVTQAVVDYLYVQNASGHTSLAFMDTDHSVTDNFGADGAGKVIFASNAITSLQSQSLTSGGVALSYTLSPDGQTIHAFANATPVFDIVLQPASHANEYSVTMFAPLDSTSTIDFNGGGYNFVGGNGAWAGFNTLADDNSFDLLLTPLTNGSPAGTVNTNANEGGISGGNSVGAGEAMRVDFVQDLTGSPTSGGDYSVLANRNHTIEQHNLANGASAVFTNITSSSGVRVSVHDDFDANQVIGDGSFDSVSAVAIKFNGSLLNITADGTYNVGGHDFTVDFQIVSGHTEAVITGVVSNTQIAVFSTTGYSSVDFAYESGNTFKIGDFGASVSSTTNPVPFTVPVVVQDADGDQSASSLLHITANQTGLPPAPPIVLDLNGDGAHFVGSLAGVTFDYFGDGSPEATAWAASDDGVLAIDLNGNGTVDDGSEVMFATYSAAGGTDLDGLRTFDTNHDGILSADDADFAKFGVLQGGEFKSLADMGIASINLASDGQSYTAADGEVTVFGTGSFTNTDGSTGSFADAAFAYKQQQSSSALANTLVAAALVAAPVEVAAAPAEDTVATNATVTMVAVEEPAPATHDVAVSTAPSDGLDGGAVTKVDADAQAPVAEASHLDTSSASAPATVSAAADTAPSELPQDVSPVAVHATEAIVSVDAVPMASAEMIQAAQTSANPGQPASLAEVLADALNGGETSAPSIDTLLANLPTAGAVEKVDWVADMSGADLHYTDAAPITAYEAVLMTPDAVTPLTNG